VSEILQIMEETYYPQEYDALLLALDVIADALLSLEKEPPVEKVIQEYLASENFVEDAETYCHEMGWREPE